MSKQLKYFAGLLLLMMAAVLAVSAQDLPALNATALNNTTLNNTTLNNTTLNQTVIAVPIDANATTNETATAQENATANITTNVTTNETIPVMNETAPAIETAPVMNETVPAMNETTPALNETAQVPVTLVNDTIAMQPEVEAAVPAQVGQIQGAPAQATMLGLTAKSTFVIGSGLSTGEPAQVGSLKVKPTYMLGSASQSTISL